MGMTGINFADTVIARIIQISITFDDNSYVVTPLYSFETGNTQFIFHTGINSSGNTYVCDYDNNNMQKFLNTGTFAYTWESFETKHFLLSTSIAGIESAGNLCKDDLNNIGVEKFTP